MIRNPLFSLLLAAVALSALPASAVVAEPADWPPIPPEDLALESNPASPGASAMVLLKRDFRDDKKGVWELFRRVKILTVAGLDYADIEIPYVPKRMEVDRIAARVIHTDGRIIEFRGPIYEKTLARRRRVRVLAKTFTLPGVEPGVIVDCRYRVRLKSKGLSRTWVVQEDLYIRKAELEFRPDEGNVDVLPRSFPPGVGMADGGKGVGRATVHEIPAFEREPFLPPESALKMRFHIIYRPPFLSFDPWPRISKVHNRFIGKSKQYREIVEEVVRPSDPDEVKLRKLYEAVQGRVRYLSYEEEYTRKQRKREGMKERKSAKDVWKLGYGDSYEIVMLFVGLCRAAGFEADPVLIDQRDDNLYDSEIPLFAQVDGFVVVVELPSGPVFYEPGVRFAPAGLLTWPSQGVRGFRLTRGGAYRIMTPVQPEETNRRHRQAKVRLRPDGSAAVELVTTYSGEPAVERRNEFFDLSDAERERKLREELEEDLPGAQVEALLWEGLDDASDTVVITSRFELPAPAQSLGDRLIVPANLFVRSSRFASWERTHPVYLPMASSVIHDIRVMPPPGYRVEHMPEPSHVRGSVGEYMAEAEQGPDELRWRSSLTTAAALIPSDEYLHLKRFFDLATVRDRTWLVFRKSSLSQ